LFQQVASIFFTGSIVVKGDPKFRAGQRIYVAPLNADFYVNAVTTKFDWGSGVYAKILSVSRGAVLGDIGGLFSFQTQFIPQKD